MAPSEAGRRQITSFGNLGDNFQDGCSGGEQAQPRQIPHAFTTGLAAVRDVAGPHAGLSELAGIYTGEPPSPFAASRFGSFPSTPLTMPGTPSRSLIGSFPHSQRHRPPQLSAQRVGAILKNFKFFQDMEESIRQKIPPIVMHARYPEGTILFRQGDPPGSCYAILSGEVGIFVKAEEEDLAMDSARVHSPVRGAAAAAAAAAAQGHVAPASNAMPSNSANPAALTSSTPSFAQAPSGVTSPTAGRVSITSVNAGTGSPPPSEPYRRNRRAMSLACLELSEDFDTKFASRRTVEGFSTYHDGSTIGKSFGVFGAGKLFGELALMQSTARSATIKCMKDSEFLVICRNDFDQVLKEEFAQANERKLDFLLQHVPGMRDLPAPKPSKPHASYFFKKASFCKGHEFLSQGGYHEETVYVICRGSVEFRRCDHDGDSSVRRAVSADGRATASRRQRRPIAGSVAASQPPPHHAEDGKTAEKDDTQCASVAQAGVRKLGIMVDGGVFGALPFPEPEPFTVVATSQCEVLFVSGQDFVKLPRSLVQSIQEHLAKTVTSRLARLRSDRLLKLTDTASTKEDDGAELPRYAKEKGLQLMQVGKIHPHPVLLRNPQQKDPLHKRAASRGMMPSESLPSMPLQASLLTSATSRSTNPICSLRSPMRPQSQGEMCGMNSRIVECRSPQSQGVMLVVRGDVVIKKFPEVRAVDS